MVLEEIGRANLPSQYLSTALAGLALGTDNIQRTILSERVLGLPREPQPDRDTPFPSSGVPPDPVRQPSRREITAMPGYASEDELYKYVGGIFEKGFADPELGDKMAATGLVFQVKCTEPASSLIIDMPNRKVHQGTGGPEPQAALLMSTETSNGYWQGKVNLPFAMARGKVKVEGNVAKLLALSPLGKTLFPQYIDMLRADGREDLIL